MRPLGNPIDKQIGDLKLRKSRLALRPQPLGDLVHWGAAEQAAALQVGKQRLDVAGRPPVFDGASTALRPFTSAFSFSRVRADAAILSILSIGVLLR